MFSKINDSNNSYGRHQVAGQLFNTESDFIRRGTFARHAATGEIRQISWNGYISRDITVRKAIASAFNLSTFRKQGEER